jgi:hypothetical protein
LDSRSDLNKAVVDPSHSENEESTANVENNLIVQRNNMDEVE